MAVPFLQGYRRLCAVRGAVNGPFCACRRVHGRGQLAEIGQQRSQSPRCLALQFRSHVRVGVRRGAELGVS